MSHKPIRARLIRAAGVLAATTILVFAPAAPALAHAAAIPLAVPDTSGIAHVIDNLLAWIMGILAAYATLCLTVGFVRYLSAGGDPGETEKAKSAFKSAAIGYAGAVLSPVLLAALQSILT
jgi:hypothetical protein